MGARRLADRSDRESLHTLASSLDARRPMSPGIMGISLMRNGAQRVYTSR
jgi:hypothetical protein